VFLLFVFWRGVCLIGRTCWRLVTKSFSGEERAVCQFFNVFSLFEPRTPQKKRKTCLMQRNYVLFEEPKRNLKRAGFFRLLFFLKRGARLSGVRTYIRNKARSTLPFCFFNILFVAIPNRKFFKKIKFFGETLSYLDIEKFK
jgi:hypothetical protein